MRVLGAAGLNQLETHRPLLELGAGELSAQGCPAGAGHHAPVEVVTGAESIRRRFRQLRLAASREVCALVTGASVAGAPLSDAAAVASPTGRRAATGSQATAGAALLRVVVAREVLALPGAPAELRTALGRGARVRVAERVPARLVVADRSLAMVPLHEDAAEPSALVVRASSLLETLLGLFESVWARSQPVQPADGGPDAPEPRERCREAVRGPDAVDLQILSLLLAGCTDTAVAKQLDLGLRTVQRRVKRLMELARVTTRLQLGWHAHERGWVRGGPGAGWDTDPQQ